MKPGLKVFDIYVRKNDGTPAGQSPIRFFRQGATANLTTDMTIQNNNGNTIAVYFVGGIVAGDVSADVVIVDGDLTKWLKITGVDADANTVTVQNLSGGPVTVVASPGSRLSPGRSNGGSAPISPTGTVFKDPTGRFAVTQPFAADANGRAVAFVADYRYDYVINVTGEAAARVFGDADGSYVMRT